jgi:hypothetical protein
MVFLYSPTLSLSLCYVEKTFLSLNTIYLFLHFKLKIIIKFLIHIHEIIANIILISDSHILFKITIRFQFAHPLERPDYNLISYKWTKKSIKTNEFFFPILLLTHLHSHWDLYFSISKRLWKFFFLLCSVLLSSFTIWENEAIKFFRDLCHLNIRKQWL